MPMYARRANKKKAIRILFHVAAGQSVGLGHLSRCRSLALEFARHMECDLFFSLHYPQLGEAFLHPMQVKIIDADEMFDHGLFDMVFVDVPGISLVEQNRYASIARLLVCIDDDSSGPFDVDILIRPNLLNLPRPLHGSKNFQYWCGKGFIILHPEFAQTSKTNHFDRDVRGTRGTHLLVCFGGSDPAGLTVRLASIIQRFEFVSDVQLIVGPAFCRLEKLREYLNGNALIKACINHQHMAEAFCQADVAIISGGTLLYEAAVSGVPSLIICQNESQCFEADLAAVVGGAINLGLHSRISDREIYEAYHSIVKDHNKLVAMSEAATATVASDGSGRIIRKILAISEAAAQMISTCASDLKIS